MDDQQPSINNDFFYRKPKQGYGYIYKYTSPDGKSYIGQTSTSLKQRARNLLTGIGYKKCSLFWKAIQKYGWQSFQASILEEVSLSSLNEKEIYYIEKYNTCAPNGYNLTIGGECDIRKDVYVYSAQNGEFLEHYNSLTEAAEETGVPIETISIILNNHNRKQAHNLVFLKEYVEKYNIELLVRATSYPIYTYDKEGFFIEEYPSISIASQKLNISDGMIRKCLNGSVAHAHYIQFKKEKEDKILPIPRNSKTPFSVLQIDPKTNQVIASYQSLASAARAVGLKRGEGIKRVAERGRGMSGGFFWKFDEGSTTMCSGNPAETVRGSSLEDEDIV